MHPEMWNNWNSRTFVANTKKKVHKDKHVKIQEEEEEEGKNPVQETLRPSASRLLLIQEENGMVEEQEENESLLRKSGKRSPAIRPETNREQDVLFREYCVFPSHSNVPSSVYE